MTSVYKVVVLCNIFLPTLVSIWVDLCGYPLDVSMLAGRQRGLVVCVYLHSLSIFTTMMTENTSDICITIVAVILGFRMPQSDFKSSK